MFSVGGGALRENTATGWLPPSQTVYADKTMNAILKHCAHSGQAFWEYVETQEGPEIWVFPREVWRVMQTSLPS